MKQRAGWIRLKLKRNPGGSAEPEKEHSTAGASGLLRLGEQRVT